MFGYVRIRKPELKIKDYDCYRGFYCGLCGKLKERHGFLGQVTLTYDMTFLVLLLSSVYELPVSQKISRCIVHPVRKHQMISTEASDYAADLNMMLSFYHFQDDKADESSISASAGVALYRKRCLQMTEKYPRQSAVIRKELHRLSELEKQNCRDVRRLADCFGRMLAELFSWKEDFLKKYLADLGYYLGRFIYIMDAYDDLKEDREKGRFNPFLEAADQETFEKDVQEMLLDEMAAAGAAFEQLPCMEYHDILANILYAGVWNRYDDLHTDKKAQHK